MRGLPSNTPTQSSTSRPRPEPLAPRSPTLRSPRSPRRRRPSRSPARGAPIPGPQPPGATMGRRRCSTPRRFHAFCTTASPKMTDTVAADKTHPGVRDHRTSPCRPEARTAGAPDLGPVHGQRSVAGAGSNRVHRHHSRRDHRRPETHEGHHRDHPPHDRRPGRVPARRITLHLPAAWSQETRLERPVQPGLRATTGTDDWTAPTTLIQRHT